MTLVDVADVQFQRGLEDCAFDIGQHAAAV